MKKVELIQEYQLMDLASYPVLIRRKEVEIPDSCNIVGITGMEAKVVYDINAKKLIAIFPRYGRGYCNYGKPAW